MSTEYDERARSFPPKPAYKKGKRFAQSWWGNAWIKAMVDTALDPVPLKKGRRYAAAGHVGTITVSPGRAAATVFDGDESQEAVVLLDRLSEDEWGRFLEKVAVKAGHTADLLERKMPQELAEDAEEADVRLLPGVGDLDPECTCLDFELPCKHAAALSYQLARLLDEDPFVLLLLRGRTEDELVDELNQLNAADAEGAAADETVPAEEAFAAGVPALPEPPPRPEAAAVGTPPPHLGFDPEGAGPVRLDWLVSDASARAFEAAVTRGGTALAWDLDAWGDAVRMAAAHDEPAVLERLAAEFSGDVARAASAWRYGGPGGLDALETPWTPDRWEAARARTEMEQAWDEEPPEERPDIQVWRNRWTVKDRGVQLRYGRDLRWYPYRRENGAWWPAGAPETDPTAVLAELLSEDGPE
ncbi:putative Zn finger protein [Nocardiopsis arvandica]|uniref:Putative Zn finger protein n=1 Tax=Nocardiopsis sinuspersici TaxID=501010 RepID=A0A7Y9XJG6_9ACTN|nr:SWIM zinc finger family protein [Nocardiopsis sinuspersici]NYH55690.1 putative Zn finger protein [Nocardiopsis sinuspersici]